jgi:prepilin-type N-terminal cleavage/methylation domain-containing protein
VKSASPFVDSRRGFSLVEIMVTVGLLSVIILGLLAVFSQTQRAFKTSMNDVDVLESGRITMEMIAREMEQTTPANAPVRGYANAINFFIQTTPGFNRPFLQALPGNPGLGGVVQFRTNTFQRFFFLSKVNQDWIGTGYQVIPEYAGAPIGTLYRYSTNVLRGRPLTVGADLQNKPQFAALTNLSRLADGVVHLRVQAFDGRGSQITPVWPTNQVMEINSIRDWDLSAPWLVNSYFLSNVVPAYVEVELGILQKGTLDRFRAIGQENAAAQFRYLSNHVADVHIFRQRVPIRNANFSVYK